ncbi:MAG: uroporphyrinogen decarboxylase family protein [Lentisphaerae bacterium]|nr:uroporphyrinogen decarboxylase family protein [Lentisphaerota bacterium]
MTPRQRTLRFVRGDAVDRPPFHPIVMRLAAAHAGVPYRRFCLDYKAKCDAMILFAEDYGADWVTVMSDPYAEAGGYGLRMEYPPDDLPRAVAGHLADLDAVARLQPFDPRRQDRCQSRVAEIGEFRARLGEQGFVVGWVEGAVATYGNLRTLGQAFLDVYDAPERVHRALDVITSVALDFITTQVEAGADCIGIGDAVCSQIGPDLYREFAFERERILVAHIHALGALAKLHICGNTESILTDMIRTGADIIDVDHRVPSMAPWRAQLGAAQVFSGKSDPVSVIRDGSPDDIRASVRDSLEQAAGRCIVSAGCELTPDTPEINLRALAGAAAAG